MTKEAAAKEVMRLIQEAIKLAPKAGLYLAVTVTPLNHKSS